MGGVGSGRYTQHIKKDTVDISYCLDVRYLKCRNMLQTGYYNVSWSRNGFPCGNVNIRIVSGVSMSVIYRWRKNPSEDWQSSDQVVSIVSTPCNFGGSRSWFLCPCCTSRVAVVVVTGNNIACRNCLNLTYASRNEDWIERVWRKRDKYKVKLGGEGGLQQKPKGMYWQTWQRLLQQYYDADMQVWAWLEEWWNATHEL